MPLVSVSSVSKSFRRGGAIVDAVRDVSFNIEAGRSLGIVGESGSGKSTLARIVLGLIRPDSGRVEFEGVDLESLSPRQLRKARGGFQAVFQEPFESLDPEFTVGQCIQEPLDIHHQNLPRLERRQKVLEFLDLVRLPRDYLGRAPRQLSGGEQQRVGIARAMVTSPRFVVLDEPTASLDLSTRAAILKLLLDLQKDLNLTYCFVSHDLDTIERMCDDVVVMQAGQVMESGKTLNVLRSATHSYTKELTGARLSLIPPGV